MGKRKQRARRDDPRTWTQAEFVERMIARYQAEWRRWWRDYQRRTRHSPYTAIERLRYP